MDIERKKISYIMIEGCPEIKSWISQFPASDGITAISMLMHLDFISRDEYSKWLLNRLGQYPNTQNWALYSVRKFSKTASSIWRKNGSVVSRPSTTQGSEDLVSSVISNAIRQYGQCFIDHPSLTVLRNHRIHNIILIDDSIGSGKRISDFINLMTSHKTFKSWWSFGFITIHVISLARTHESERFILEHIIGSDHGKRKRRLSDKLRFDSKIVYSQNWLHNRWGQNWQSVLNLCDKTKSIPKGFRRGFGKVMGNIVFYHSVPNNIPGVFFKATQGWKPLFPKRAMSGWCCSLLDNPPSSTISKANKPPQYQVSISDEQLQLLLHIKRGIRRRASIAFRMDCDVMLINELLVKSIQAGLVSDNIRLTDVGLNAVIGCVSNVKKNCIDRSLYVPTSWCTGL